MSIEWTESLATGNMDIDNQHKELFRRFDTLLNACNQSKGKEEVYNTLLFLDDYIHSHFAMEEQLQKSINYPHYSQHKEQHESFIGDLNKLKEQFAEGGVSLPLLIKTNQTLVNWFIKHIHALDQALANYVREKR